MSSSAISDLADRLIRGDVRALARALTLVENRAPETRELIASIFSKAGGARIIGLTGPPGVGKSTLADALAERFSQDGGPVAVLAIDPSSPFSGGALLGDRARMERASRDASIFIRSMASRGHVGGLATAAFDAVSLLEASGKKTILIETVGVGQDEVEVAAAVDTTVVVLAPGLGDDLQANKAGLMEIADLLVVNKADRPGADQLMDSLAELVKPNQGQSADTAVAIRRCVATTGEGIDALVEALNLAGARVKPAEVRRRFYEVWLRDTVRQAVLERLSGEGWDRALDRMASGDQSPHELAEDLLDRIDGRKDETKS